MKRISVIFLLFALISIGNSHSNRNDPDLQLPKLKKGMPSSVECLACVAVMGAFDLAITSSLSIHQAEKLGTEVCLTVTEPRIQSICPQIVATMTPTLFPILVSIGFEPRQICEDVGYCESSNNATRKRSATPNYPFKKINPARANFYQDSTSGTILHLSDIHWDDLYTIGTIVNCNEPLCCRPNSVQLDKNEPPKYASYWGENDDCDIPQVTLEALLASSAEKKPTLVVITGDNTPHDIWNQTKAQTLDRLKRITQIIAKHFPNTPIVSSLGNHDSYPVDQFNRKKKDAAHIDNFEWLLEGITEYWSPWILSAAWNSSDAKQAISTLRNYGFYSVSPIKGLRVAALNTFWSDSYNWYNLLAEKQGDVQFAWLEKTLGDAVKKGEKVLITGHIPPSNSPSAELASYITQYLKLMNKYSSIIVGQLYGHTHKDEFHLQYTNGNNQTATGMVYVTSSATAFGMHPGYRMMKYNPQFQFIDYDHYLADLTLTNNVTAPVWKKTYSPKTAYGMKDLSAASWDDFAHRISNDVNLFNEWYFNKYTRTSKHAPGSCDESCRRKNLCAIFSETSDFC